MLDLYIINNVFNYNAHCLLYEILSVRIWRANMTILLKFSLSLTYEVGIAQSVTRLSIRNLDCVISTQFPLLHQNEIVCGAHQVSFLGDSTGREVAATWGRRLLSIMYDLGPQCDSTLSWGFPSPIISKQKTTK